MINIECRPHELTIKGHAEYGEPGKDLVCCAVSTLFFALIETLDTCTLNHLDIVHEKGLGKVKAVTWTENKTVDDAFLFTMRGLQMIAQKYPEYVKVSVLG